MVCCVIWAQGCVDRGTRLESTDARPPSEQVLRDQVTFQIPSPESVWGVGIVGNLPGTGSTTCPPQVRSQLRRMMSSSFTQGLNLEALILSPNTAVVTIEGEIPGSAIKSDTFDIRVRALDKTGACSLAGGWLYRTDLALPQTSGQAMLTTVATAEGAMFMPLEQRSTHPGHTGSILGGGRVVSETSTHVILKAPGFKEASAIRNLINTRFGVDTARAVSPAQVDVRVPPLYRQHRWRFWAVVEALPLAVAQEALDKRLDTLIQRVGVQQDLDGTEIALEAMGQVCVPLLSKHLQGEPVVALAAARCLSSLGYPPGLSMLAQMAGDPQNPCRIQAMHALVPMAKVPQVSQFVAKLLGDPDLQFAMDVYESLCMKDGVGVQRETVAGAFTLDTIDQSPTQAVIATRRGGAHLALFGSPIQLKPGQMIEFSQKKMTIDSRSERQSVIISSRSGSPAARMDPVKCANRLRDIIPVLCKKPGLGGAPGGFGLGYDEVLGLIGQLSHEHVIGASLWAGPLSDLP